MPALVVVVNEVGEAIGTSPKMHAHQCPGLLHRAFSAFLLDRDGRLLLQQRSSTKAHFSHKWSNSCCSHPRPEEHVIAAGRRRVTEELGVVADLREVGTFTYHATDPVSGFVEREFDHVLVGTYAGSVDYDPAEVADVSWVDPADARRLSRSADTFSPWFHPALEIALAALGERNVLST